MSHHASGRPRDRLRSAAEGTGPGYPSAPDYSAAPDYPPAPGYPSRPDYAVVTHDEYGPAHAGYALAPGEYRLAHEPATARLRAVRPAPEPVAADTGPEWPPFPRFGGDTRLAMLGYLTVPLFGFVVPLAVYLRHLRGPDWTRAHAAQALNVWITAMLYDISALIMGAVLALDSPQIALVVFGPLVVGVWLATLRLLVHAATAASNGREYTFPGWLCSRIVR
jgi:uncharacterized Tic20 family protein